MEGPTAQKFITVQSESGAILHVLECVPDAPPPTCEEVVVETCVILESSGWIEMMNPRTFGLRNVDSDYVYKNMDRVGGNATVVLFCTKGTSGGGGGNNNNEEVRCSVLCPGGLVLTTPFTEQQQSKILEYVCEMYNYPIKNFELLPGGGGDENATFALTSKEKGWNPSVAPPASRDQSAMITWGYFTVHFHNEHSLILPLKANGAATHVWEALQEACARKGTNPQDYELSGTDSMNRYVNSGDVITFLRKPSQEAEFYVIVEFPNIGIKALPVPREGLSVENVKKTACLLHGANCSDTIAELHDTLCFNISKKEDPAYLRKHMEHAISVAQDLPDFFAKEELLEMRAICDNLEEDTTGAHEWINAVYREPLQVGKISRPGGHKSFWGKRRKNRRRIIKPSDSPSKSKAARSRSRSKGRRRRSRSKNKMKEVRYNHCWGDEDILAASVTVTELEPDVYEIVFVQEGFNPAAFQSIRTPYEIALSDESDRVRNGITERVVRYIVTAVCNPRPETFFELY